MEFFTYVFAVTLVQYGAARSILTSALVEQLINSDDVNVRPDADGGPPVVVGIGMTVTDLEEIKDRPDVYRVHGYVDMKWKNSRLSWDPADYGNITEIRIPSNQIWLPDISLYNNMQAKEGVFSNVPLLAVVYASGQVTWVPTATLPVMCKKNESEDGKQTELTCHVSLGSWVYSGKSLDVKPAGPTVDSHFLADRFQMLNSSVTREAVFYECCPEMYPKIAIDFKIARLHT